MEDILPWVGGGGTVCSSAECPEGHCALVQNVRGGGGGGGGDIPHGGTIQCTDIVYGITLQIESQTQMLRAEAVVELRQCDYGDRYINVLCDRIK